MYSLYLFQLLNNKWFIVTSLPNLMDLPLSEIQTDYEVAYEFINTYPIVSIEKIQDDIADGGVINSYVKQYMKQYGIDNVRGGCYSGIALEDDVIKVITKEINFTLTDAVEDMNILYDIKSEYHRAIELEDEMRKILLKVAEIKHQINTFIVSENNKLNNDYNTFVNLTDRLTEYRKMKSTVFDDINWLLENIDNNENIRNIKKNKERYLNIVNIELPQVTKIFTTIVEDPDEYRIDGFNYEPRIHIYSPNTVLDCVFISNHNNDELKEKAKKVINRFEYMAYVILNRTMELEFDINSYPKNYSKRYNISKAFVKRIEKKID